MVGLISKRTEIITHLNGLHNFKTKNQTFRYGRGRERNRFYDKNNFRMLIRSGCLEYLALVKCYEDEDVSSSRRNKKNLE